MTRAASQSDPCGIRVAASAQADTMAAVAEVKAGLGGCEDLQHIVAFFSANHDAKLLNEALCQAFPGVPVSGCTTAGEIAPGGMMQGGLVLIAFPKSGFRVVSDVIEGIGQYGVERANAIVRKLKSQLAGPEGRSLAGRVFALILVDGLSNAEERLVAAVHWAIDDVQLVGGSAGDGLAFDQTSLFHGGRALDSGAILIMVESDVPFKVFKSQNFEPTAIKPNPREAPMKSPYFIYGERKSAKPEPAARAARALVSLPPLPSIPGATMVTSSHPDYAALNVLHNKRNYAQPPAPPALRVMCPSMAAVAGSANRHGFGLLFLQP